MIYVKEFRAPQTYREGTNKEHITKGVHNGHLHLHHHSHRP